MENGPVFTTPEPNSDVSDGPALMKGMQCIQLGPEGCGGGVADGCKIRHVRPICNMADCHSGTFTKFFESERIKVF